MDKYDFLLLKFAEYLAINNFSERTIANYTQNVRCFFEYLKSQGIENIMEADRQTVSGYQAAVYMQTFKGKPLSPVTQRGRINAIKALYRYLIKNNLAHYDPTSSLSLPKCPSRLPRNILSKKEVGRLLSAPSLETPAGLRDRAILELFYATGVRTSELCNLTINDIDLNGGELRINQGKNAKDRIVPLGEAAREYLEAYLKEARPKLAGPGNPVLFATKSGRKFRRSDLSAILKKYAEKAGIKKFSPYTLRHTCATHLLKGKAGIRHIQQLLGHSSVATTQRYTRVEIADLKQVLKRCHPRSRKEIDAGEI